MLKHSKVALVSLVLLSISIAALSSSKDVFSQQYEKQPRSMQITQGIMDVDALSGRYVNFDVPSDATDARLVGKYQGFGGNQQIEFRVGADCSDNSSVNSCSKQYAREDRAVSNVNVGLDSGKRYVLQFWNKDFLGTKQVDSDLSLEYNVLVQVQSSNSNQNNPKSGCLIATAAFGSELSPQVQFLRNFRDDHILATSSGSGFMSVFNSWYYSFSPAVADFEREQPIMQQAVKIAIYPLLGILQASEKAYVILPGEYGSISAGLVGSSLIGAVYASPIALSIKQIRRIRLDYRIAGTVVAIAITSVSVSLTLANQLALMITTSILVVSTLSVAAILFANAITRTIEKRKTK